MVENALEGEKKCEDAVIYHWLLSAIKQTNHLTICVAVTFNRAQQICVCIIITFFHADIMPHLVESTVNTTRRLKKHEREWMRSTCDTMSGF